MEKTTNSASSLSAEPYTIRSSAEILACSPYKLHFKVFQDSSSSREQSWEIFGTPSLPIYFNRGMDKFQDSLEEFADLSRPFSIEMKKQLPFMLDALLYVRNLISEMDDLDP